MRLFIIKVLNFLGLCCLFFFIYFIMIFYVSTKVNYKINYKIKELYVGDSHIQCAINDKILENSLNLGEGGELFYYTYFKLQKILKNNPHIHTVNLGFSYHSLSSLTDINNYGNAAPRVAPKYFHMLPFYEKCKIVFWASFDFQTFIKKMNSITYNYYCIDNNYINSSGVGGFSPLFRVGINKQSVNRRLQSLYFNNENVKMFSKINIDYFAKIVNLCKKENVKLIIINTPLPDYLFNRIPRKYVEKYKDIIRIYNLECVNYNKKLFSDNCFWLDGDHVSYIGANRFTNYIRQYKKEHK